MRSVVPKLLESTGLYFLVSLYSFQGASLPFLATAFVSYLRSFHLSTPFFIFSEIFFGELFDPSGPISIFTENSVFFHFKLWLLFCFGHKVARRATIKTVYGL